MKNVWTLSRMTFREAIRRRIVLTGVVLGLCFVVLFSLGFHFIITQVHHAAAAAVDSGNIPAANSLGNVASVETENTLLLAGLYAVAFLSIAMGALLGADAFAREIESGTIQTIVTKPVRRAEVVFGKWLGFAAMLGVYFLLTAGGTVLSVFAQTGYAPGHLPVGLALIYFESLLIMTVALMCSSAFSALATGGIIFGLYGLAFIGGWIEQFGAILQNQTAVKVGIVTSLIIPSEALWHRAAFEMQTPLAEVLRMSPFGTISVPSVLMVVYAVVYLLVILFLAVRIFQARDL